MLCHSRRSIPFACLFNFTMQLASSPWSNAYFPAIEDGFTPSAKLRNMEIEANALFDVYRQLCVPQQRPCSACHAAPFRNSSTHFYSVLCLVSLMVPEFLRSLDFLFMHFLSYRYFEGGFSSVYFWEIDDSSFASCWLIQKGMRIRHQILPRQCTQYSHHLVESRSSLSMRRCRGRSRPQLGILELDSRGRGHSSWRQEV